VRQRLALLASPTYRSLGGSTGGGDPIDNQRIDVAALAAAQGVEAAHRLVTQAIVEEVSRVMRLPKEDVALSRPLSEAGLDSLMAIELAANLQDRFAASGFSGDSPSGLTVLQLAEQIVAATLKGSLAASDFERTSSALRGRHLTKPIEEEPLRSIATAIGRKDADAWRLPP
jgi:hypothetical protein